MSTWSISIVGDTTGLDPVAQVAMDALIEERFTELINWLSVQPGVTFTQNISVI